MGATDRVENPSLDFEPGMCLHNPVEPGDPDSKDWVQVTKALAQDEGVAQAGVTPWPMSHHSTDQTDLADRGGRRRDSSGFHLECAGTQGHANGT